MTVFLSGLSKSQADGLYVNRFVTVGGVAVVAGNTRTQVDQSGGTETVLENPTGVVQGGSIPANADADSFLEATDGGRFGQRVKIARIGNTPVLAFIRGEGSFAAPTPPLSGATLLQINPRPVTAAGGPSAVTGSLLAIARENIGAAATGTLWRFIAGRVGAASQDNVIDLQSGGAGVSEIVSGLGTLRLIPGATAFVIRDNANTFDAHVFAANGLSALFAQSTTTAEARVGTGSGSGETTVAVRSLAGQISSIRFVSGSSDRWLFRKTGTAESGGNAGSDVELVARTDAGGNIDSPLTIVRAANGAITLGGTGNRQVVIAGTAWGAGAASLRFNGLTSGAGANAGTLGNAPSAGNPSFWLPVSIAGAIRYIPCWT